MSEDGPVQVPRWAFRLAGGTILMGMVAFFTTAIILFAWLMILTWGITSFSNESRSDRKALHEELEAVRVATERIEQSSKQVERAVAPEGQP